jgi:ASPIC and UnbV
VQLVGTRSNRSAIGARIRVEVAENGRRRSIYKYINSGGTFGANPLRQTIGLGRALRIERLEVFRPTTGLVQAFRDVPADQFIRVVEGERRYTTLKMQKLKLGGRRSGGVG